jgi:flagellar hook assembly protein FlgD
MAVQQVSSTTTATDTTKTSTSVTKDQFLQILITQLKYQNPLEPLKPDEFLSQLSQLTEVEQLTNIAKNTEQLTKSAGQGGIVDWLSAVGKKVGVEDNTLTKGDEIVLTPKSDYDEIILTFKNLDTGNVKEVRLTKGQPLTYTYNEEGNVGVGITPLKDGKVISCGAELYRVVAGIQAGDSGVQIVLGDGQTLAATAITKLRQ